MGFRDVIQGFVEDRPFEKKWCPLTHHTYRATSRTLSYDDDRKWLIAGKYSTRLAVRVQGTIILNGDLIRDKELSEMQQELRNAFIGKPKESHVIIPFEAFRPAALVPGDVRVIDRTYDTYTKREVVCRRTYCRERPTSYHHETKVKMLPNGGHSYEAAIHHLGETYFHVGPRHFVCGFDRNDGLRRRSFYLTELPEAGRKAKTVDEALLSLRPQGLPETTLRQGEWFFVPTGLPMKDFKEKTVSRIAGGKERSGVAVVTENVEDMGDMLRQDLWSVMYERTRAGRHVASKMMLGKHVYVAGTVKDEQHDNLRLGDGKEWFRVVKNLAIRGWTSNGKVD